jgi:hypothetical protein
MFASLSPLRDRSNDASLSPVASYTPLRPSVKSRLGGVTPTPKPMTKPSALRPTGNAATDSVRRTSTPIGTKENKKLAAAAGKPLVFDKAVLASPGGGKLKKVQSDNDNLRELNKQLIDRLRAARLSTKEATDTASQVASVRAADGEHLTRVGEENAALRSLNEKIILHLRTSRETEKDSVHAEAAAVSQKDAALADLARKNEESLKLRELNGLFIRELRDSRTATKQATAAVTAASAKAGDINDQLDAANAQNARLRDLNQKFISSLRESRNVGSDAKSANLAQKTAFEFEQKGAQEFLALAKAEQAQLKRLNEELGAELAASLKATETLVAAAANEQKTTGAEMVKLSNEENKKLRSVNVVLIDTLREAQRSARETQHAMAGVERDNAKLGDDKSSLIGLNAKLIADLRDARRLAKDAHVSSQGAAAAAASTREMFERTMKERISLLDLNTRVLQELKHAKSVNAGIAAKLVRSTELTEAVQNLNGKFVKELKSVKAQSDANAAAALAAVEKSNQARSRLGEVESRNENLLALNRRLITEMQVARVLRADAEASRAQLETLKQELESSVAEKSAAAARLTETVDMKQRLLVAAFARIKTKEDSLARALGTVEAASREAEKQLGNAEAARKATVSKSAEHTEQMAQHKAAADAKFFFVEKQRVALAGRLEDVSASLSRERVALDGARNEVKSLENQLRTAARELRDSCEQLTAASLALSSAAADNAEKDSMLSLLNLKIAELEDLMAQEAQQASADLAAAIDARAEEERRCAKLAFVISAARAGAQHKHASHKKEKAQLVSAAETKASEASAARADAAEQTRAAERARSDAAAAKASALAVKAESESTKALAKADAVAARKEAASARKEADASLKALRALRLDADASANAANKARDETEKSRASMIKAVEQATVLHNKNLSLADRKLTLAMASAATADHALAESKESVLAGKASLAAANQALAEAASAAAEHVASTAAAHAVATAAAKKAFETKTLHLEQELVKARLANDAAHTLAQTLRAAHAKQIAALSAKQSADLQKIKEIARKTNEEFKKRSADAERRAAALREELCSLKVALLEAREACAAAVGETNGAKRLAKMTAALGFGCAVVARKEIGTFLKSVTEKTMEGK